MKWVTRERARVDRIACPWLISRFIDPEPEFIFVPAKEVVSEAKKRGAIPYDIPNVDLGHHGPECSFDAFVDRYELTDPALRALAVIVRGADTDDRDLTPESSGLYAAATGSQRPAKTTSTTWRASSRCMTRSTTIVSSGWRPRRRRRACCSSACTAPRRASWPLRTSAGWRRSGVSRWRQQRPGPRPIRNWGR